MDVLRQGLAVASGGLKSWDNLMGKAPANPGREARQGLMTLYRQDRVGAALSMHAARQGAFPDSLGQLVEEGRLEERDLSAPTGPFTYQVQDNGRGCLLEAPGPKQSGD